MSITTSVVVISGADANSKLVRAEGFKGSLFNLTGEQGIAAQAARIIPPMPP